MWNLNRKTLKYTYIQTTIKKYSGVEQLVAVGLIIQRSKVRVLPPQPINNRIVSPNGGMVDARDSKPLELMLMSVRVRFWVPIII